LILLATGLMGVAWLSRMRRSQTPKL
jgi:hypothetical protein